MQSITVVETAVLPVGKFKLECDEGMSPLRSMAMQYGSGLALGGCSCERVTWILEGMAKELECVGALVLQIGVG